MDRQLRWPSGMEGVEGEGTSPSLMATLNLLGNRPGCRPRSSECPGSPYAQPTRLSPFVLEARMAAAYRRVVCLASAPAIGRGPVALLPVQRCPSRVDRLLTLDYH